MATAPASPPLMPAETGYVSRGSRARGRSGATGSLSTLPRAVETTIASTPTSIASSFSCGRTSRNHPKHPATNRVAPRMLTEALVTRPAMSSVTPNARMMGQAVGAGRWIVLRGASGACSRDLAGAMWFHLSLAPYEVNHGEHNYPDHIYEMPIERKNFGPLAVFRLHFAENRENHGEGDPYQPYRDVKRVQPYERVIRRSEQVRAHRQTLVVNQVMPLTACAHQKNRAERQGYEPPQAERANFRIAECTHG